MTHICDCEFCESCGEDTSGLLIGVPVKRHNKERAVIEAAKALLVDDRTRLQSRVDRIVNATHALLEQELRRSDE